MMKQAIINDFVLLQKFEYDEEGINYNFWIYPQHPATMWEVP